MVGGRKLVELVDHIASTLEKMKEGGWGKKKSNGTIKTQGLYPMTYFL